MEPTIYKKIYANHSKNHKQRQMLVSIPPNREFNEGDIVKIVKVDQKTVNDDILTKTVKTNPKKYNKE